MIVRTRKQRQIWNSLRTRWCPWGTGDTAAQDSVTCPRCNNIFNRKGLGPHLRFCLGPPEPQHEGV